MIARKSSLAYEFDEKRERRMISEKSCDSSKLVRNVGYRKDALAQEVNTRSS